MGVLRFLRPGIGQLATHAPRPLALPAGRDELPADGVPIPLISIVVPSFNQGAFIEATLRSLIEQRYPRLELIVVDGGSTDDTLAVIRRYEHHLAWWVSEPDGGQTAALNKGFAHATGDVMAWLNSDDLAAPGALHRVARHFIEHPSCQVVYGNRILIDDTGMEVGRWTIPYHSPRVLRWADYVPQETLYWRRGAWERVDARLDERFRFAMDWDLLLRFSAAGLDVRHIPAFLGLFRVHPEQKTSSQLAGVGFEEMQRLRERCLGDRPSRRAVRWHTVPYLLLARLRELVDRIGRRGGT